MKKSLMLLSILCLTGCTKKQEVKTELTIIKPEIEYNQKISLKDVIKIENGTIKDEKIDTTKLGTQTIVVKYKDKNNKNFNQKIEIEVKDRTAPLLLHRTKFTYKIGSKDDLLNKVICGDNYDDEIKCEINGTYDLNKVGEYKLEYIAKDSSNNETKSPFELIVKEEIENQTYTPKNVDIKEFINTYKNDKTEIGIDVSTWQGIVDYEKVKASGISSVMIRAGFSTLDGRIIEDNKFENNITKAREAGLNIGLYFYSKASSIEQAKTEANWIIEKLNNRKINMPIAFDWEIWDDFNSLHISYTKLNNVAQTFIKTLEESGLKGMLYGSASYLEKVWDTTDTKVWLAHYTKETDYDKEYMIWQQTASGIVPGIEGNVDLNVIYKSEN